LNRLSKLKTRPVCAIYRGAGNIDPSNSPINQKNRAFLFSPIYKALEIIRPLE
jgi:hypothetical protein